MKKYIKFSFVLLVLFFLSFTINKCYAISTKEEVDGFKKTQEEYLQKNLKERNMRAGRANFGTSVTSTEGTYISIGYSMIPYSMDESYYLLDDTAEKAFKEYLDKYLDENMPDDERLVDYIFTGSFIYTRKENYKDGDDIEAKVSAYVFPASEDTIWSKDKIITELKYFRDNKEVTLQGYCTDGYYIRLVKENDKYVIKFIDTLPEGYSEFVQKVKDKTGLDLENINYADFTNAKSKTEVIAEAAEKENLESANVDNQVIVEDKISIVIAGVCALLIVIIISIYSSYLRKIK